MGLLKNQDNIIEAGHVWRYISDASIINSSLYIRVQYIVPIPSELRLNHDFPDGLLFTICPHRGGLRRQLDALPTSLWRHSTVTEQENSESYTNSLQQCGKCRTEYQISLKRVEQKQIYIFITKWQELGYGTQDIKWAPFARHTSAAVQFEPGSIQGAFEGGKPFVFDSVMTSEDKLNMRRSVERLARYSQRASWWG